MKAYKLLRKLSDGNLYPLFIHKTYSTPINEWMQAECYPTKGFAVRCGWHCSNQRCNVCELWRRMLRLCINI